MGLGNLRAHLPQEATVITWLVNTSSVEDPQFQTYTAVAPPTVLGNGSLQRNLTITVADNGVEFNNTRIRCVVVNSDDVFASFESLNFIIVIQGTHTIILLYLRSKLTFQKTDTVDVVSINIQAIGYIAIACYNIIHPLTH